MTRSVLSPVVSDQAAPDETRPDQTAPGKGLGVGQQREFIAQLTRALDGTGPALALGAADNSAKNSPATDHLRVPDAVALVVTTSGSTAQPRRVLLDSSALLASAHATQQRLGGPGQWLLTLPATHVAGVQVLVRSVVAGTEPVFAGPGPFRPEAFTADVARMAPGVRRYVSLVPTQLHRLLAETGAAGEAARHALRTFDAILVGGAALSPDLARRAAAEHLEIRTTYGMTETCGGCVYDAVPLPGVRVRTDETGRLQIAGPMLMRGYLGDDAATAASFADDDDVRWLRTNDLGTVTTTPDGVHVTVTGRADDVIICGGVNVPAAAVEAVLAGWNGIGEVCVVPRKDPEWGQVPVAVITVTPDHSAPELADVQAQVRDLVGKAAAPRELHVTEKLPTRGPGKYDRHRVRALLEGNSGANPT